MSEPCFKSSLSMEEIEENFKGIDFFSGIMDGLQEALAYEKGEAAAQTYARKKSLPDIDIVQLRKSLDMTQREFSGVLGVSPRTVEAWESGKTTPTPTARKLMSLIQGDHSLLARL